MVTDPSEMLGPVDDTTEEPEEKRTHPVEADDSAIGAPPPGEPPTHTRKPQE